MLARSKGGCMALINTEAPNSNNNALYKDVRYAGVPVHERENHALKYIEKLPFEVRNAILETSNNIQNSPIISLCTALSVMSFAVQKTTSVKLPSEQVVPTSLYLLCLADSGEGKTAMEKLFTQAICDYAKTLIVPKSEFVVWEEKQKAVKNALRRAINTGNQTEEAIRGQELKELIDGKPFNKQLIYGWSSASAILDGFTQHSNALITLSEGGDFLILKKKKIP